MRLCSVLVISTAAFATGLAYEPEALQADNFKAILKSIIVVENDTVSLDKVVLGLAPNLSNLTAFQNKEKILEKAVNITIQTTSASSPITSTECTQIFNEVKNNLLSKTEKLIKDIIARKDIFRALGNPVACPERLEQPARLVY